MANDAKGQMMQKMDTVSNKIAEQANLINQYLLPLLENETLQVDKEDIEKIVASTRTLEQRLLRILKDEVIFQTISDEELPRFLAKVRHDLRDLINAIQGYTEISLEEFQKTNNSEIIETLLRVNIVIQKISSIIDEVRLPSDQSSISPRYAIPDFAELAEPDIHSPMNEFNAIEYRKFKTQFSILIVDDVSENCRILERHLNNMGIHNIQLAHDAFQALGKMEKNRFDLILLDIDMPGMSGIELLQDIKKDILNRNILVVMITGADSIENAVQCIKYGAEDMVLKPFNADLLRVRINACLEKKWFANKEKMYQKTLETEQERYKTLLHAVFPQNVISELLNTGTIQPKVYPNVGILCLDVINFTTQTQDYSLEKAMAGLQKFAELCEFAAFKHNIQKIKIMGDSFLAVSGMFTTNDDPVLACIRCVKEIFTQSKHVDAEWQLRAGITYGDVTGGIIGNRQCYFDIWSDAVNIAIQIKNAAGPGAIHLSHKAYDKIRDKYRCEPTENLTYGNSPLPVFELKEKDESKAV